MSKAIELGCEVRDLVTGLKGIATGRIEYLNGCVQYSVKPKMSKDGKVEDAQWIDVQTLERTGDGIVVQRRNAGGLDTNAASPPRL